MAGLHHRDGAHLPPAPIPSTRPPPSQSYASKASAQQAFKSFFLCVFLVCWGSIVCLYTKIMLLIIVRVYPKCTPWQLEPLPRDLLSSQPCLTELVTRWRERKRGAVIICEPRTA